MPRTRPPYSEAFRYQMIELIRSGPAPAELAEEFEPTAQTISNWVAQADRDSGKRTDGPTTEQLDELKRLRSENKRLREEREILSIAQIHKRSHGTYGAPRIHAELRDEGWCVSTKRVAPLDAGVRPAGGQPPQRDDHDDSGPGHQSQAGPGGAGLHRRGAGSALRRRHHLCPDVWAGFLYLAVVLDVFSRRVVGWSMAGHMRTELVLDALEMAPWQRFPEGVIHHSDRGSQHTSIAFGNRCREAGVRPSISSVGDCYDNSMAESSFATL